MAVRSGLITAAPRLWPSAVISSQACICLHVCQKCQRSRRPGTRKLSVVVASESCPPYALGRDPSEITSGKDPRSKHGTGMETHFTQGRSGILRPKRSTRSVAAGGLLRWLFCAAPGNTTRDNAFHIPAASAASAQLPSSALQGGAWHLRLPFLLLSSSGHGLPLLPPALSKRIFSQRRAS